MAGRPCKYTTQEQRLAAKKASTKKSYVGSLRSRYFHLVIPNLVDHTSPQILCRLKGDVLIAIRQQETYLQYYSIAVETHPTTGVPHLDILLLYQRPVLKSRKHFDYLVKHGDLTRYRKLNEAILKYNRKQDLHPLTNLPSDLTFILKAKQIQTDPYSHLYNQMIKDPFHFDVHQYLARSGLHFTISKINWSKAVSLLKKQQQVECNRLLTQKPGFQLIIPKFIRKILSRRQYGVYRRNTEIYDRIISKLNEVPMYGCDRPHKTKNLLLVGPPNTGKTSLALEVQKHVATYYMGVSNWFPSYRSRVYRMILWNQFSLRTMSYPELLNFLQGTKMDLQYKGGSTLRTDNQLILMTSNMTLEQHISSRFKSEQSRQKARANLRARIQQVILPKGVDLFLLQRLITEYPTMV